MKKTIVLLCPIFMLIIILLSLTSIFVNATAIKSGVCGENLKWEVEKQSNESTMEEEDTLDKGYIPVVQRAIEETKSNILGDGYGALYDVDRNGIEELIMVYTVEMPGGYGFTEKVCSVYTMSNGEIVQLIDKEVLFVEVGGPSGHVAVVENKGGVYLAITFETGETGFGESGYSINRCGGWKLYTINDTFLELHTTVEYDYFREEQILYEKSTAIINGQKLTYKEYEIWRNNLKEILMIEPYGNENLMTLEELLEYLKDHPAEDTTEKSAVSDNGLVVYSDYTNLSISTDNTITLSAGILIDGEQVDDVSGVTFQIEDTSILSVSTTGIKDNCRYVVLKGLKAGTTTVIFNDSNRDYTTKVLVTVYDNHYHSYTLSTVPTQYVEKYSTNIYNVNGLYIDSYTYKVNDDLSATVTFDVYNTNYAYGVVEVLNENGNVTDAVLIDKMTSSNTSIKEAVWDNIGYLIRDIVDGDLLSYRQESGYSKKTSVSIEIPKNGYIKICTDPENSLIVGLVNSADVLMSVASIAGEVKGFDVSGNEFAKKLTKKLITEKMYVELIKDGDEMPKKLWEGVGREIFLTSESMGYYIDTIAKNITKLNLGSIIADTAADFGWSIGEDVFTYFSGPAGVALNVIFIIGKIENVVIQQNDLVKSAGTGTIVIQNQGGGLRASQQIAVESKSGFSEDIALNVFNVTFDSTLLDILKKANPELCEAICEGITYTYNISLLQNGKETQPVDAVTLYIPIPEDLKMLAYMGKTNVYRIEEDGTMIEMDAKIEKGCFVFTTDHFSLYTIVGNSRKADTSQSEAGSMSSVLSIISIIGIGGVVIVGVIVIVVNRKKKK